MTFELVEVMTSGDLDRQSPVAALTETGAFVRAVQAAVLDGRADIAVHSCKDTPVSGPEGLSAIHPFRESPHDVLVGSTLSSLRHGARVGTGSPRRSAQLRLLRPDVEVVDIRGNVDTRIGKLAPGTYDAIVLAEAGLNRLGRRGDIAQVLNVDEMVPAAAQGALAVEAHVEGPWLERIRAIEDRDTTIAVALERNVLERTGAGCRSALAVFAERLGTGTIHAKAFTHDDGGSRRTAASATDPAEVATRIIEGLGLSERVS
jgi:hydroxymethylbilane synthase